MRGKKSEGKERREGGRKEEKKKGRKGGKKERKKPFIYEAHGMRQKTSDRQTQPNGDQR
jgi:hypothetical protein